MNLASTLASLVKLTSICLLGSLLCQQKVHAEQENSTTAEAASPATSMNKFCANLPRPEYANLQRIEHQSTWFEIYKLAPGITAIYEPHQWQEVISYLIEGEKSALLFDSGNGIADIAEVVKDLTSKPVVVLNSHGHYDHVGGNYQFDNILGMDTDFTRLRQKGRRNSDIAIEVSDQALCTALPEGVTTENHIGRPYSFSKIIKDGYKIDLGGRTLEVMHIPGHTPDAIALIDRGARLMWTGDSYYSGPIWLFAEETNLDDYAKSLDRMIAETANVDVLLPAHNTPWVPADVLPRVKKAMAKMLAGESNKVHQGDGMVEHHIEGEKTFSFLMRDEALPYSQ